MKWLFCLFFLSPSALAQVPLLELGEAAKLASKSLSSEKSKSATLGEATQLASLKESKDLKASRDSLMKSLKAEGLSLIDTVEARSSFAFTVENKAGARAIFVVNERGGVLYAVPKPTAAALTGSCQKIPEVEAKIKVHTNAINQLGGFTENAIHWGLTTQRVIDVDGDAILDALVPVYQKGDCPEQGFWELYVVRGSCGYLMGKLGPGLSPVQAMLSPLDASGFRPLTMESKTSRTSAKGVRELVTTTTIFSVSKGEYSKQSTNKDASTCQHCASWYCTSY
jgi:hypothetical protein